MYEYEFSYMIGYPRLSIVRFPSKLELIVFYSTGCGNRDK